MPNNFQLRDVPPDVWAAASARADRDGWPMRVLLIELMRDYAAGRLRPSAPPPPSAPLEAATARVDWSLVTLHETMWTRDGADVTYEHPIQWELRGLPQGHRGLVGLMGHRWQYLYRVGNQSTGWSGDYATRDEAIAALQLFLTGA